MNEPSSITVADAYKQGKYLQDDPVLTFPVIVDGWGVDDNGTPHREHIVIDMVSVTDSTYVVRCCICGASYDMDGDEVLVMTPAEAQA